MTPAQTWVLRWTEDADGIWLRREPVPIVVDGGGFWMQHERLTDLRRLWSTFASRVYRDRELHADVFDLAERGVTIHGRGCDQVPIKCMDCGLPIPPLTVHATRGELIDGTYRNEARLHWACSGRTIDDSGDSGGQS